MEIPSKFLNNIVATMLLCQALGTMYCMEKEGPSIGRTGGELLEELAEQLDEPTQTKVERVFSEAVMSKNTAMIEMIVDYYCGYLSPDILSRALYHAWKPAPDGHAPTMHAVFRCSEPLTLRFLKRAIEFLQQGRVLFPHEMAIFKTDNDKILSDAIRANHLEVVKYMLENLFGYINVSPEMIEKLSGHLDALTSQALHNNDPKTIKYILENFSNYLNPATRHEVTLRMAGNREIMNLIPWFLRPPGHEL